MLHPGVFIFPLLFAVGFYTLNILPDNYGLLEQLGATKDSGLLLPSSIPLVTRYTGITYVDSWLALLVSFFFPVTWDTDSINTAHNVQLFTLVIFGYIGMLAESYRHGRHWALSRPSIWGVAFQMLGGAVVLPLYCLLSTVTPRPQVTILPDNFPLLLTVSACFGSLLPTVIALLPAASTPHSHQIILAMWQFFPVYTSLVLSLLLFLLPGGGKKKNSTSTNNHGMRRMYEFAFAVAAGIHIYTTLAHLPQVVEMYSPSFDPMAGPGMEFLLKWDYIVISAALVAWVLALGGWRLQGIWKALVGVVVVGPAAVVAGGLWALEKN